MIENTTIYSDEDFNKYFKNEMITRKLFRDFLFIELGANIETIAKHTMLRQDTVKRHLTTNIRMTEKSIKSYDRYIRICHPSKLDQWLDLRNEVIKHKSLIAWQFY